ncbi:MAG: DUF4332 domain-containing protein [Planctomycetota bacterium]
MLLERIDIDRHGPLDCVEIGPMSQSLNVLHGPTGSGKTAITRFIRDSLLGNQANDDPVYPLGMMSSSNGRIVWADRHGLVHCYREQDGTRHGRRTIEVERRDQNIRSHYPRDIYDAKAGGFTTETMASECVELPPSIVDGIVTDTAVTNVARVVASCIRSGLDAPETYRDVSHADWQTAYTKARVENRTPWIESRSSYVSPTVSRDVAWHAELDELHRRGDTLRYQKIDNERWIDTLKSRLNAAEQHHREYAHDANLIDPQLQALDSEALHLRRVLDDLNRLRDQVIAAKDDWTRYSNDSITADAYRRYRYDDFLYWIDHGPTVNSTWSSDPNVYRSIADIEWRLDSITRHLNAFNADPAGYRPVSHPRYGDVYSSSIRGVHDHVRSWRGWLPPLGMAPIDAGRYGDVHWTRSSWFDGFRNEMNRRLDAIEVDRRWITENLDRVAAHRGELLVRRGWLRSEQDRRDGWQYETIASLRNQLDHAIAEDQNLSRQLADIHAAAVRMRRSLPVHEASTNVRVSEDLRHSRSPLMDLASGYLSQLTGGAHREIRWTYRLVEMLAGNSNIDLRHAIDHPDYRVRHNRELDIVDSSKIDGELIIDGQAESQLPASTRAIAALAVRLAAGSMLERLGRPVPIVIETANELYNINGSSIRESYQSHWRDNYVATGAHPLVQTLTTYANEVSQILLLTSDSNLAEQLSLAGGRRFDVRTNRIVHEHQPHWHNRYSADRHEFKPQASYVHPNNFVPSGDANRDLDIAWREDDVFYTDHTTTSKYPRAYTPVTSNPSSSLGVVSPSVEPSNEQVTRRTSLRNSLRSDNPFYLSVDSPIDQAPSVDAVAAARLRSLDVTHITHLMQRDSNRLADAMGMADVEASTIRRWKAECRLVCRVPHLRGFDAKVLVGSGITTPDELASMDPVELLQSVEGFLATKTGQQLLLSGSSHELSRLTSWIASANAANSGDVFDSDRYEHGGDPHAYDDDDYRYGIRSTRTTRSPRGRTIDSSARSRSSRSSGRSSRSSSSRRRRSGEYDRQREPREIRSRRRTTTTSRSRSERDRDYDRDGRSRRWRRDREARGSEARSPRTRESSRRWNERESESQSEEKVLKFYLNRQDPVVDAPSIGPRMASRLEAIGIVTVDDLLNADATEIAEALDHRRVDAETVLAWQQQSTLVCRVPMLRGHDAQLLVAAEITTPEELATQDPESLFPSIDEVARSSEGKRIVRGGKLPDLEEVTEWVQYASHHRSLQAA